MVHVRLRSRECSEDAEGQHSDHPFCALRHVARCVLTADVCVLRQKPQHPWTCSRSRASHARIVMPAFPLPFLASHHRRGQWHSPTRSPARASRLIAAPAPKLGRLSRRDPPCVAGSSLRSHQLDALPRSLLDQQAVARRRAHQARTLTAGRSHDPRDLAVHQLRGCSSRGSKSRTRETIDTPPPQTNDIWTHHRSAVLPPAAGARHPDQRPHSAPPLEDASKPSGGRRSRWSWRGGLTGVWAACDGPRGTTPGAERPPLQLGHRSPGSARVSGDAHHGRL